MKINLAKILTLVGLLLVLGTPVFAGVEEDLARNRAEQDRLQRLINDAHGQANTLKNQISRLDNEIRLTQLQINDKERELAVKEAELAVLNADIGSLTVRIGSLETSLDKLAVIAIKRFRAGQAVHKAAPLESLIISGDFDNFSTGLAYLEYVQREDQRIFEEMRVLKRSLTVQKTSLQEKQAEVQLVRDAVKAARDSLASAKAQLSSQKSSKAQILRVTQNNEANYQRLLESARREAEQIALAYQNKGGSRYVRKGEVIGTEGCSGYCFGTHLHFGIHPQPYSYYSNVNPCGFLSCDSRGDTGYIRSGRYQVPIYWPGTDYANVSQWWGDTWFSQLYWAPYGWCGGRKCGHTGIDMYTYHGDVVRAVEEGQAYFYRGGQSRGNGVFVYHPDGMVSLYWHLN